MSTWEKIVNKNLKQTKQSYLSGMRVEYPDPYSAVFIMEGKGESKLGLMLERGADVFEIREGMQRSDKKKTKKDGGWYMNIPFRMATSEAIAESSIFSNQMPKPIENLARKLEDKQQLTNSQLPPEFQTKGVRQELTSSTGKVFPKYTHKSSIYVGLQHSTKKSHGQYNTFRTISDTSDKDAFIHPGFTPRNFMEQALNEMQIDTTYEHLKQEFLRSSL